MAKKHFAICEVLQQTRNEAGIQQDVAAARAIEIIPECAERVEVSDCRFKFPAHRGDTNGYREVPFIMGSGAIVKVVISPRAAINSSEPLPTRISGGAEWLRNPSGLAERPYAPD